MPNQDGGTPVVLLFRRTTGGPLDGVIVLQDAAARHFGIALGALREVDDLGGEELGVLVWGVADSM
jgi:hypothetical protein